MQLTNLFMHAFYYVPKEIIKHHLKFILFLIRNIITTLYIYTHIKVIVFYFILITLAVQFNNTVIRHHYR